MKKSMIAASLAAVMIAACSSTPAYHEARYAGSEGYSEAQLDANSYRVEYRLKDDDIGRTQDLALLRAAELTLYEGYDGFEVVSRSSDVTSEEKPTARFYSRGDYRVTRDCGLLTCRTSVRDTYTPGSVGTFRTEEETVVAIEIVMHEEVPANSVAVYDARSVKENIEARL